MGDTARDCHCLRRTRIPHNWKKSRKGAGPSTNWKTQEWLEFLQTPRAPISLQTMAALDAQWRLTNSGNYEILAEWLGLAIETNYAPAFPKLRAFLHEVGRTRMLRHLYVGTVEDASRTDLGTRNLRNSAQRLSPYGANGRGQNSVLFETYVVHKRGAQSVINPPNRTPQKSKIPAPSHIPLVCLGPSIRFTQKREYFEFSNPLRPVPFLLPLTLMNGRRAFFTSTNKEKCFVYPS